GKVPEGTLPVRPPAGTRRPALAAGAARAVHRQPTGSGPGPPCPAPRSQSFSRGYGSILPTSLAYIVPSTAGSFTLETRCGYEYDRREWHSVLRIFKGRRGRTGHHATCGALPQPPDPTSGRAVSGIRTDGRSAGSRPRFCSDRRALLLIGARHLPRRPGIGRALKRHPFSGLVDSAGRGRCAPDASNHWLYPIELVHGLRLSRGKLRREPATRRFD
ncbi:unnamed protein product, partial [Prunus brigantina]